MSYCNTIYGYNNIIFNTVLIIVVNSVGLLSCSAGVEH